MKYKLLKRMGLYMLNGMFLLGAVFYPYITVSATSSQMSEIDRVLTEETTELIKSTAEQQGTKKTASQTKWNRNMDETSVTRQTYIGSGTTKIEIFYSSNVESPQILLQAPNKKIYHPGTTTAYEDTLIVYRKGYVVADYPDIKYDILYISESQDPGMWDIAFTVDEAIDEFVVITARPAEDWENFHTDYKTAPTDIIIWEMSNTSHYTANDITSIVAKDEVIPQNHITETVVIETKSTSPIVFAVIGIIVLVITGTVIAVIMVNRAGNAKNREKENAIKNANKRLRLKKKKEDETLDKVLEAYESQYSDDDYFASLNQSEPDDAENNTNINFPMPDTPSREREQNDHNPRTGYGSKERPDATVSNTENQKGNNQVKNNGQYINRTRGGATREINVERETKTQTDSYLGASDVNNIKKVPVAGKPVIKKENKGVKNEVLQQKQQGDRKSSAMGANRGAGTYTNQDINRSLGKFSSASPTIPETKPQGGRRQATQNATPDMNHMPKPSWMIAAENAKNNQNENSEPEDFF